MDYVDRVIPAYSRDQFKQHFRVYPETFDFILHHVGPALKRSNRKAGRETVDPKKQLLIAIWFMATPDSYRSIHTKFGVGKGTAFRAVQRVSYALYCLAPHVIKWPTPEEIPQVTQEFQHIAGFPGVIGAIDGTHIKINPPKDDRESYINRKGYPSIILQVVCNARTIFTHCYAGEVGSVHDARVLRKSRVSHFLENPVEYFSNDTHLIGDSAYPLREHLLVPFRDNSHLTMRQRNFNYCLSATRMCIERSIGLLKIRFRILLDCLPLVTPERIPQFIIACCVLHNLCMMRRDIFDLAMVPGRADNFFEREVNELARMNERGNQKRINIMNNLPIRRVN